MFLKGLYLRGHSRLQNNACSSHSLRCQRPLIPFQQHRCVQIPAGVARELDNGEQQDSLAPEDPWLAPQPSGTSPLTAVPEADRSAVVASQPDAAQESAAPPSPWDVSDSKTPTAAVQGSAPAGNGTTVDATPARGPASLSEGRPTPTSSSATAAATNTSSSATSSGSAPSTASATPSSATASGAAARVRGTTASGLSEDTAALLARLRAELARSSAQVGVGARRGSGGGGVAAGGSGSGGGGASSGVGTGLGAGQAAEARRQDQESGAATAPAAAVAAAAAPPNASAASPPGASGPTAGADDKRGADSVTSGAGEGGGGGSGAAVIGGAATPPAVAMSPVALAAALAAAEAEAGAAPKAAPAAPAAAAGAAPLEASPSPAPAQPAPSGPFSLPATPLRRRKQQPPPQEPAATAGSAGLAEGGREAAGSGSGAGPAPRSSNGASTSYPASSSASASAASSAASAVAAALAASSRPGSGPAAGSTGRGSGGGGGGRRRRAVVVGGGIGGLVSAGRLAREGFEVVLLEANSMVGGRCQSVQRGRFRFDTGPSLLLFPDTYRKAFAALGTSLAQQVPVVRVTPAAYRVFFQGAGSLDLLYDVQRMVEQLEGVEKGAGGAYLDWLASSRAALSLGLEGFIERDAQGLGDLIGRALQDEDLRALLRSVGVAELLGNHHDMISRRFRDPRLRALFTFQDLYVGLTPYTAPGVYSLLAATELTDGVWYPLGGFGQIRDALARVASGLGVRVRCGARVTAVRTEAGEGGAGRAVGVTLASGEEVDADVVVSNRDVPLSYELLRGAAATHGSATSRRLLGRDFSAGVIAFNWSMSKRMEQLLHHNVFLSGDFEGSWVRATGPDNLARSPNFYVHCPARTDPTAAPAGSDSVMVLLPVANIQEMVRAREAERHRGGPLASLPGPLAGAAAAAAGFSASSASSSDASSPSGGGAPADSADYASLVAAGREAVLRSLAEAGMPDVRQHITDELVIDPVEWRERYGLAHGAAFGMSHGLTQLSVFRPGVADKQVRGLYFVGASTRPGNGVPLTMISADIVTQRVMQDVSAGVV